MPENFLRSVAVVGTVIAVILAAAAACLGHALWACGILVGMFWMFLNIFFLFQLVEMGFSGKEKNKNKVFLVSVLKFPVIYLTGFFILKNRYFPVESILIGLTVIFVALGMVWARFNLTNKEAGKILS